MRTEAARDCNIPSHRLDHAQSVKITVSGAQSGRRTPHLRRSEASLQRDDQCNSCGERSQHRGMVQGEAPPAGLTRTEITAAEQHQVVACPGQADMAPDIERVVHRVAHAERVLDGGKLVRRKTGA